MGPHELSLPSRAWLATALIAPLTTVAVVWSVLTLTPLPVRVEADLQVSSGARVNLYVNDLTVPPRSLPVVAGQRHRYVFEGITDDIRMLRVDPTDDEGAAVDLYSIAVVGAEGPLAIFGPAELAGWATDGIEVVEAGADRLRVRTTTPYSIVTSAPRIPLPRPGGSWTAGLGWLRTADVGWRLVALGFLVAAAVGTLSRSRRTHLPLLAAVTLVVSGAAWLDLRLPQGSVSAAVAVSRATYRGLSTLPGTLSTLVVLLGGVLCGAAMSRGRATGSGPPLPARTSHLRWWLPIGLAAIVVVTAQDLSGWAIGFQQGQFTAHWDINNLTYWSYLSHRGYLPLRDFWYPYAGFFLYDLPFPVGPTVRWLFHAALFGTLYASIAVWLGGGAAALAVCLTWTGHWMGILSGAERYLLSAVLVISYMAAWTPDRRPFRPALIPFWCACALALTFDPAQAIYAGAAIGAMTVFEFVRQRTDWRSLLRGVSTDLVVPAVIGVLWLLVCSATGQLAGMLEFYTRLGDAVAYAAFPAGFPELGAPGFPRMFVFIIGAAFAVAVGVTEIRQGDGHRRRYGYGLTAMGLLSMMVLQKHLVRWMDDQLLVFSTLTLVLLTVGWPGRRGSGEFGVLGVLLGVVGAALVLQPAAPDLLPAIRRAPGVVWNNGRLLLAPGELVQTVNRARFARERFSRFAEEQRALDLMRSAAGPGGDVRAAALTDEPIVYLLTGQPAVWMANMYDASPIYRQERVARWMREERPPFLVFRRERLRFDEVPVVVRDPIVVQEAVASYVPFETGGELLVLRLRMSHEPVAWSFWREQLGEIVELGRLAGISSYEPASACAPSCADLLVVSLEPRTAGRIVVPIRVRDTPFAVAFEAAADEPTYRILLDRIWFWSAGKAFGLERRIDAPSAAGVRVELQTTRLAARLY